MIGPTLDFTLLPLCPIYARQIHRPGHGGAAPDLARGWGEFGTLVKPPDAQPIARRVRLERGGIDRRAAFRAEGVCALISAFCCLDVDLRHSALQHKRSWQARDAGAKHRPGQLLAIGAVTDLDRGGVHLRLISDVPTMTSAGHFHGLSPQSSLTAGVSRS